MTTARGFELRTSEVSSSLKSIVFFRQILRRSNSPQYSPTMLWLWLNEGMLLAWFDKMRESHRMKGVEHALALID
jgi:hypothetical protein